MTNDPSLGSGSQREQDLGARGHRVIKVQVASTGGPT